MIFAAQQLLTSAAALSVATTAPGGVPPPAARIHDQTTAGYSSLAPSFLTFDSRLTTAQITASPNLGRYSFVWGAHATHVSAYRANQRNPGIKLGYYISYDRFGIPRGQNASSPFDYWNQSEHFDWLLYKCDRVTPVTWGDSATAKTLAVVDPGNPEVVTYQLQTHAARAVAAGYDAISADNVHLSNVRGQCGVWQKGKTKGSRVWKQLYTPTSSHSDPAWANAVVRWAQQFSAGLKKLRSHAGRPIDLVPNFSVQSSDGWADKHTLAMMNATDGALSENGFTRDVLQSSKPDESDWVETVRFFQNLNRHGKPLWAICQWGGSKSVGDVSITEDVRQWVAATFMMGRGAAANASGVALVPVSEYGNWSDWPEFALPVGTAIKEAQQLSSGVWYRTFTAAVSIVNPGNVSRQAVVPIGSWKSLDGKPVPPGPKTLAAQTGLVLLKQESEVGTVLKTDDEGAPLHSLADVRDHLGNHTLYKAMGSSSDWLVANQILTPKLPTSICSKDAKNLSDWTGAFVGDLHADRLQKASNGCVFSPELGPYWHVGQAAKALALAAAAPVPDGVPPGHADKPRLRWQAATHLAGAFLLRQIRDDGLVVGALENTDIYPQTSTALEGLDALFVLANLSASSNATLAHVYTEAGVRSASWYAHNAWVRGTGLCWDFWDVEKNQPVKNGSFDYFRLPLPQLPASDDGSVLDAWVAAGRPSTAHSPLLSAWNDMLERLLRDEHPPGNWDAYLLCDGQSNVLCHRRAYWWGGIPFLKSWQQTGNRTHLAAAVRVGEWYLLAQRLDGGVFRQTTADGRTRAYGLANSAAAAAAIIWMQLFQATGDKRWLQPTQKTLQFILSQQIQDTSDRRLRGVMIESVDPPPSGTDSAPWFVRDIASTFTSHAIALLLSLSHDEANGRAFIKTEDTEAQVPYPWSAVKVSADESSATVSRRQLEFGAGPLPSAITADSQQLLTGAAAVAVDGCAWTRATLSRSKPASPLSAVWHSRCITPAGSTAVNATTELQYDGWLTCELIVINSSSVAVTIPMRSDLLYNHGMIGWTSDWNFRFNKRYQPELEWWAGEVPSAEFNLSFTPQLWLGDGDGRGVAFLADGPTNWSLPYGKTERDAMFVSRESNSTLLTVTMIEPETRGFSSVAVDERVLRFSLMPTPVRPLPTRADLQQPKISPAVGWTLPGGRFNTPALITPGVLTDPGPLSALSGDVSLAIWIKIDASTDLGSNTVHIVGSNYMSVDINPQQGTLTFVLLDTVGQNHSAVATAPDGLIVGGKWSHVVVSHSQQTTMAIIFDGVAVHSDNAPFTFQSGPSPFTIGERWHGAIADLRVLACGMTLAEAQSLYHSGSVSARTEATTVVHWDFTLSDATKNGTYATSLWPSLTAKAGAVALVANDEVHKAKPTSYSPGTVVAGPSGHGTCASWALQIEGRMIQASSNTRNVTMLAYLKQDLHFDFIILWEMWSDIWGFPGFTPSGGTPYKAALKKLLAEAHKVGLKILPYIDVSMLSSNAPDFEKIHPVICKHDSTGKCVRGGNISCAGCGTANAVDISNPVWRKYWLQHLQDFIDEWDVDGFYTDESDMRKGGPDKNGRAAYNLADTRAILAETYQMLHAKGMIQIQDNSVPALSIFNYYTDILLTGEIHYMLLQYHNLTHVQGRPLRERVAPAMAQAWWTNSRANVPVVYDTKPPTEVIHFNGGKDCPSYHCGWDRQKILTTRELKTVSALHGMSLWGPVGTNAEGTVWTWWEALDSVGCHGSGDLAARTSCRFKGYWELPPRGNSSHNQLAIAGAGKDDVLISRFDIQRNDSNASELLLLIANYGEATLSGTTLRIPSVAPAKAWTVKRVWPAGASVAVGSDGITLVVSDIQQHELWYVHLSPTDPHLQTDENTARRMKHDDAETANLSHTEVAQVGIEFFSVL